MNRSHRHTVGLDAILEHTHEAYVSIDTAGRVRAWNPEAERTFGWSRDAAVGRILRDLIVPPRYREQHDAGLRRFVETGEGPLLGHRIEIVALHRNGNEFPVELTISAIRSGDEWTFHAFVHDISERYRALEVQARLAAIVEHSVDAIVTRSRDGTISSWNPAAERLYGWSAEQAIGRRIDVVVPPERHGEGDELLRRALAGEAITSFETQRMSRDGRRIDVSITMSPIRDDGGAVNEVAVIVRDIGTRKRAERTLAEAVELKAQFVATASHELRTPLTSIAGFTSTLLERWEEIDDEQRLTFLRVVEEQCERLRRLVDDVLLLSRIDAGAVAVTPPEVVCDAAAVARAVKAEVGGDEVRIRVEGTATVAVAADAVHRIVLNYVANALAHAGPPVEIELVEEERAVRITVADRGPGVLLDAVPQLFFAFTQPTPVSARGAGLGLAIVRGLAENAGGEAWYEPGAESGARFSVRLPRA